MMSMISKNILAAAVVVIILVIGGAYYLTQQPSKPTSTVTPTLTPTIPPTTTPTQTVTPTVAETSTTTTAQTASPTATPTATITDEDLIRELVNGYYDTFNRHLAADNAAFFTDDGIKLINHGKDATYKGREKITQQLTDGIKSWPDMVIENVKIAKLEINADKAIVQCKYLFNTKIGKWSTNMTENMELVKIGSTWKIAKVDVIY